MGQFESCAKAPPEVEPSVLQTDGKFKVISDIRPSRSHKGLHGFHFRKINEDGTQGPLRDTILVTRSEVAEIAFVADNPGDWLFHCHMLEHTAAGMLTWVKVV